MKFFLDTADVEEIKTGAAWGIVDGVTTNPSLVAKSGRDFHEVVVEICEIVRGPVSAEVLATDYEGMVREARELAGLSEFIVVKIPFVPEGLRAIRKVASEGIRVNCTLIFSPAQALMAAKAGSAYVSPFLGRLDDVGHRGMDLVEQIRAIYDNYVFPTEVLAASLRHPMHVVESALAGADVATIPFGVMKQMFNHPLTDIGLEKFLADWDKRKQ
jgi:transaldolase